jgi:hypothetical protein
MILRLVADPRILEARPTSERLVRDGAARVDRGADH